MKNNNDYCVILHNNDEFKWWIDNNIGVPVDINHDHVIFRQQDKNVYWNKWIKLRGRFYSYRSKKKMEENNFIKYVGLIQTTDDNILKLLMENGLYLQEMVHHEKYNPEPIISYRMYRKEEALK